MYLTLLNICWSRKGFLRATISKYYHIQKEEEEEISAETVTQEEI